MGLQLMHSFNYFVLSTQNAETVSFSRNKDEG